MTLSPDGKWFWDGTEWIPAPPAATEVVTQDFWESPEEQPDLSYTPTAPPSTPNISVHSSNSNEATRTNTAYSSGGYKTTTFEDLTIKIVKKGIFPSAHLRIRFTNPNTGVEHDVSFKTWSRTWTAKITNGHEIGKIKLNGITLFSGTSGFINLPDGDVFKVFWTQGFFGVNGKTITLTNTATGTVLCTI